MIYFAGWISLYLFGISQNLIKYRGNLFALIVLSWFSFVVVFRANVGTDTYMYEWIIENREGVSVFEFGFDFIIHIFKYFTDNSVLLLRLIGALYCIVFFVIYCGAASSEKFLILYYLIPVFFYIHGMNVIRIGMASLFFYLFVRSFVHKKIYLMVFCASISLLMHYSIAVAYVLFLLNFFSLRSIKTWFFLICCICAFYFFSLDHISAKYDLYESYVSPNVLSGLTSVLVIMLFVFAAFFSDLPKNIRIKVVFSSLFFLILFYLIVLKSYAGLRLLDIMKFTLPVLLVFLHQKYSVEPNRVFKYSVFIAGLVSIVFIFKNFLDEPVGPSMFLPYKFIFS